MRKLISAFLVVFAVSAAQAAPSISLDAGTAAGWNLNDPDVLLQTIYGTQRNVSDQITANRMAESLIQNRGAGLAFEVTAPTTLDTLTLKLQSLVTTGNTINVRMYDVSSAPTSYLKTGFSPSKANPGGVSNPAIFDLSLTHTTVPFHVEPIIHNTVRYTDLVIDFDDMVVNPGIYFITVGHPVNALEVNDGGNIIGGNNGTDNNHMIFFGNGSTIPNPTIPSNNATLGNFRYYTLSTATSTGYTGQNDRRLVMQLLGTEVPEPASLSLLAASGLLMLRRNRHRA